MAYKKLLSTLLCLILLLVPLSSCKKEKEPEIQAKSYYEYFDTVSTVISYAGDSEGEFKAVAKAVEEVLGKYHKLLDIYYEYSGINNVKTVNKNAGVAPVKVDRELIDFLLYAKEIYAMTGGKTNIAMGSVLSIERMLILPEGRIVDYNRKTVEKFNKLNNKKNKKK